MSKFNPFTRRDPEPSDVQAEESGQIRQESARRYFERVREQPPNALPDAHSEGLVPLTEPPQLPTALDVAKELDRARDNGWFNGAVRQTRREADAEAQVGVEIQRKLDARRKIVEQSEKLVQAQNTLKGALFDGQILEERKQTELQRARQERLLAERQYKRTLHSSPEPGPVAMPSVLISNEQIHAMALRIVLELKKEAACETRWQAERAKLYNTLPPNIAREVEDTVVELRNSLP